MGFIFLHDCPGLESKIAEPSYFLPYGPVFFD